MRIKWTRVSAISRADDEFDLTLNRRELEAFCRALSVEVSTRIENEVAILAIEQLIGPATPGRGETPERTDPK